MKNAPLILVASVIALALASCSNKNDRRIACSTLYVAPSINFQVTNASDFTMPVYTAADIQIYLKTGGNKMDTIHPVLKTAADQRYFSFHIRTAKQKDTCYIKVADLKTDTLAYAISNTSVPCPEPYISELTINQLTPQTLTPNAIVQIKK